MKYEFRAKPGSHLNDQNAQIYGQRLYELMQEKGKNELTPADVVSDAKKKSTVYHDFFEWDDGEAAKEYRLQQARHLLHGIVKVKIVEEREEPVVLRAFHCVYTGDNGHKAYIPEEIVFRQRNLSAQVIETALREAESWNNRYRTYSELAVITMAIDDTLKKKRKEKSYA